MYWELPDIVPPPCVEIPVVAVFVVVTVTWPHPATVHEGKFIPMTAHSPWGDEQLDG